MEDKLIVGQVLWLQFGITLNDNIPRTIATQPGANNNIAQSAPVIIAPTAGSSEK